MRTLLTIALAAIAGIHCTASAYSGAPSGNDQPAVTEEAASTTPVNGTAPKDEGDGEEGDPRWAIEVEGLPPMLFTTTVAGDDNALYAAGTFAGSLTLGSDTIKSKGREDVVLVRFEPDGRIAWVKSIGSTGAERGPKVTFVDGTVRILAETEGEVDCGSGDMGKWSSGMFFYCLYSIDGTPMGGGTFPTGAL